MERHMESLEQDAPQALDFTSNLKRLKQKGILKQEIEQNSFRRNLESLVLDLSCKKRDVPNINNMAGYYLSLSFTSLLPQEKEQCLNNFSYMKTEGPPELRNFMVTPPSDSNSPKETGFELKCNNEQTNSGSTAIPQSVFNSGIPQLPISSALLANGEIINNKHIPIISLPSTSTELPASSNILKKIRPFKAYPNNLIPVTIASESDLSAYQQKMKDITDKANKTTNVRMRRVSKSPGLPTSTVNEKDAAYRERRRKNNEAAKRSRDARRAKEDEIAIKALFFESENKALKFKIDRLLEEVAELRRIVYSN